MSAQEGDKPAGQPGRRGDVQARRSDDGSFELVVENTPASTANDSTEGGTTARPGAESPSSRSRDVRRLSIVVVGVFALVGVAAYALCGDDEPASQSTTSQAIGFRPYQGGPGERSEQPDPAEARGAEIADEEESAAEEIIDEEAFDDPDALEEPTPEELLDEEQAWEEFDQDGDVIVVEEGEEEPDEEDDEQLEEEEVYEEEPVDEEVLEEDPAELDDSHGAAEEFRGIDREQIDNLRNQIQLQRLPAQQLEKIRPNIPAGRLPRAPAQGSDEPAGDYRDDYDDSEYPEEDERWNGYDEGR